MPSTYLVTGGMGCIGAWSLYHLLRRGKRAVCFDLSEDRHRLDLLMTDEEQAGITFVRGDLTDPQQVSDALELHGITHVLHLAALQIPFCRANPALGSQVNVTGTVNIFEAARAAGVKHVVYASSIAVYGRADEYPPGLVANNAQKLPHSLYGAYKVANELTAGVYWSEYGISSTALRPYSIYGVGRDQGLTSEPTKAMQAAAAGRDYSVGFGGRMQFQFASDVAQQFIEAAEHPLEAAAAFNLGTPVVPVQQLADIIMAIRPGVRIAVAEQALGFPEGFDDSELRRNFRNVYETPLEQGIRETIEAFARASG